MQRRDILRERGEHSSMVKELTLYVSVRGDDANTGGCTDPFLSIGRARDEIRSIKGTAPPDRQVRVLIREGYYFLDEPLVFDTRDSGSAEYPITYAAFPGENPVISGGREVTTDWVDYDDTMKVATLGITGPGNEVVRVLSVNGVRQRRARAPNAGFFEIQEALGDTSFRYHEGDIERWKRWEDAEAVVFHSWNETRFKFLNISEDERVVELRDPHARHGIGWSGAGGPNRYYIENALELLDEPGEWYFDAREGKLYHWFTCDHASARVVVAVLDHLVRGDNIEHVIFSGLTFSDTNWHLPHDGYPDCGDVGDIVEPSAISLNNARFCIFEGNTVKNTGTYAVEVNGSGNVISNNHIFDSGGGGIITRSLSGDRNRIACNHIHHCGEVYPSSVGINVDEGGGDISHNHIHHITHSGIYTRHWGTATQKPERRNQDQSLLIECNEIHDVMTIINDGGGIFVRDGNIIIRNNLIHDVFATGSRCPGRGIYLGCETRDTLVEDNIVYRCRVNLIVWYNNRNVTIRNNVFVDAREAHIRFLNPEHLSHKNVKFSRNIVYSTYTYSDLMGIHGERSLPVESDSNIVFSALGCVLFDPVIKGIPGVDTFTTWRERGFDRKSITADPLFVDFERDNFTLKDKSPAFRVGFSPIDMSTVGLRGNSCQPSQI